MERLDPNDPLKKNYKMKY